MTAYCLDAVHEGAECMPVQVELRAKQMGELEGITYAVTNAIAPNE